MLKIYQTNPYATFPKFATKQSACFDISACIREQDILVYGPYTEKKIFNANFGEPYTFTLLPTQRAAIPTGLILDIPEGHSVRLHPRSGLALKNGVTMTNCEGIIDSDYTDELKIILTNTGVESFVIYHGDRICQAELVKNLDYTLEPCYTAPKQKTDRNGGFGSTGVST